MNDTSKDLLRGYKGCAEIVERMKPLHEALTLAGKHEASIHLKAEDYDFVRRWPKAAALTGFRVSPDGVTFGRRVCHRMVGEGRKYKRPPDAPAIAGATFSSSAGPGG